MFSITSHLPSSTKFSSGELKRLLKNKKSKKSMISYHIEQFLPDEIIIEILSWLPVESLLRFKCVSKQWYSLIQDPRFIMKHSIQSNPVTFSFQIQSNIDEMHGENFQFVSCTRGLVLEMNYDSKKYRIRNPFTRQILDLPAPQNTRHRMKLFDVPNTIDFKVISVSKNEDYEFQILTVATDEQWRPLKLSSISNLGKLKCIKFWQVNDFIHCIRLIAEGSNLCIRVDSLDKGSECFSTSTLPKGFFSDSNEVRAMSWNGCLAFADIVGENLNIMVLENCKEQKWSERKIIVPLTFLKEDPGMKENLVPYFNQSNNLWFLNDEELFSYNIKLKKITYIESRREGFASYNLQPSLITFKGMQPEKDTNKR